MYVRINGSSIIFVSLCVQTNFYEVVIGPAGSRAMGYFGYIRTRPGTECPGKPNIHVGSSSYSFFQATRLELRSMLPSKYALYYFYAIMQAG